MPAEPLRLLAGWGGTPVSAGRVATPANAADVKALLDGAAAGKALRRRIHEWPDALASDTALRGAPGSGRSARGAVARGLGRSYGDAAQNAGGTVIDATALSQVRGFDGAAGVLTADAGLSLDTLLRAFVPLGWFVPVSPGTRYVTLGGALAADVHGKNHHHDGTFAGAVTAARLTTPTGEHRISPAEDPELFWATAGGMGLTGVITEVTLRLLPIATAAMVVDTERARDLDDLLARMDDSDHRYRYSVAWIDCTAGGRALGRAVLTRGDHAPVDALAPRLRRQPLRYLPGRALTAPPGLPSGLVRPLTARLANAAWYRRSPRRPRTGLHSLTAFFHPLDGIGQWNRVYGRRGFVQYQFAVPFGAEHVLRTAIEALTSARCPSVLAVLKRFGPANDGPLSFPIPGWTLALDLPVGSPALAGVLDGLDAVVAGAGGRVYLAKDARLRPELLPVMYPHLEQWRRICDRVDPDGVLQSDLARRLRLREIG